MSPKKLQVEIKESLYSAAKALFQSKEWNSFWCTKKKREAMILAMLSADAANLATGYADLIQEDGVQL